MKTLLVTGGAGFIGSNFIRVCLTRYPGQFQIINLDKLTYAGNPASLEDLETSPHYQFVEGDIGDEALVGSIFSEGSIDAVVNFAAESHVDRSIDSPEPFVQTNVVGTLRLLNQARLAWENMQGQEKADFRFLHVSTDEVYGSLGPDDPPFHETKKYEPNSPYAASKAASDHLVRSYHHTFGLPVLTTNCSNNYGPFQFPEKLIPLMILNALEGKDLPIYGDGMNIRDWLYVEDHCEGILAVLRDGQVDHTYNIGGNCERPNIQIVDTICEILDDIRPRKDGKSYQTQKVFVKDRPGHDRRYAIDCRKIKDELGWEPLETFETGIQKTVQWYLDHESWCSAITEKKYNRERLGKA